MKKIILTIILLIFSLQANASENISLPLKDKLIVNNITEKINNLIDTNWDLVTSKYVSAINKILKDLESTSRNFIILTEIKTNIIAFTQEKYKKDLENLENSNKYETITNFLEYKIDMNQIRDNWLWYYNNYRHKQWLEAYSYDTALNSTAQEWSDISMSKWAITHRRDKNDSYYDYKKITSWFKERWIMCSNINWITHTENIWRWFYKCSDKNNCTEQLSKAMADVFNMYASEKNKANKVHYESIVKKEFQKVWFWISIRKIRNNSFEFYTTTHFCSEIQS